VLRSYSVKVEPDKKEPIFSKAELDKIFNPKLIQQAKDNYETKQEETKQELHDAHRNTSGRSRHNREDDSLLREKMEEESYRYDFKYMKRHFPSDETSEGKG